MTKKLFSTYVLIGMTSLVGVNSTVAYAGFSFQPALAQEEKLVDDVVQPEKMENVIIEPVDNIQGHSAIAQDIVLGKEIAISQTALAPVEQPAFQGDVVNGFGAGIPLVIAVRQIVPARYGFVFGDDLDLGLKVDWQGGLPWNQVLDNLGVIHGFSVIISGNTVSIQSKQVVKPVEAMNLIEKAIMEDVKEVAATEMPVKLIDEVAPIASDAEYVPAAMEPVTQELPMPVIEKTIEVVRVAPVVSESSDTVVDVANVLSSEMVESEQPQEPVEPFKIQDRDSVWTTSKGQTLRSAMQEWADVQDVSLVWNSEYDYPIQTDVSIVGNFEKAVRKLLDGFSTANPKPVGKLYENKPAGTPVLVVETIQVSE